MKMKTNTDEKNIQEKNENKYNPILNGNNTL